MPRRLLGASLALALVVGLAPRAARADLPSGSGSLSFSLRFWDKNAQQFAVVNPDQVYFHMNRATCICAQTYPTDPRFQMGVYQQLKGVTAPYDHAMETWVGTTCDDATSRTTNKTCEQITSASLSDYNAIYVNGFFLAQIPTDRFIEPNKTGCQPNSGTNGVFDLVGPDPLSSAGSQNYDFDTMPPNLPTNFRALGGEGAIQLFYDAPSGGTADTLWYQALCATQDGKAPFASPPAPKYYTANSTCGVNTQEVELTPSPVTVTTSGADGGVPADAMPDADPDAGPPDANTTFPDAAPTNLPVGLQNLDKAFVCGTAAGTGNSMRIEGLENGIQYYVVFLAIDKYGNASGTYLTSTVTPQPVTDFWEDLHDSGDQVDSGFCLISDTYGDGGPITNAMRAFRDDTLGGSALGRAFTRFYYAHLAGLGAYARAYWPVRVLLAIVLLPLVLVALAWHVLTLPGLVLLAGLGWWLRRRRRRGRTGSARAAIAAATIVLCAIGARAAHAQDDEQYWNTDEGVDLDLAPEEPTWIAAIKLGPYVPQIDAQFHDQTASKYANYYPYRHMFGGYNIIPVIELDRIVAREPGLGVVTVGGDLGYLGKVGNPYVDGSVYTDPNRPRSAGDSNSFRMVPMALLAGVRLTALDDRWGIPLIPYVKGGLAYDVWWMTAPNGNFSYVGGNNCHPTTPGASCAAPEQRAVGGSAGLQGAIGIAIRAERIDADAASSMRSGGVEHAGFYAELQTSWVNWFGESNRLSVGDTTWFAGFDFEF